MSCGCCRHSCLSCSLVRAVSVHALQTQLLKHLRARKAGVQGQECCLQGAASIAALCLTQQMLLEVLGCILGSLPPPVAIKDPCAS